MGLRFSNSPYWLVCLEYAPRGKFIKSCGERSRRWGEAVFRQVIIRPWQRLSGVATGDLAAGVQNLWELTDFFDRPLADAGLTMVEGRKRRGRDG